MTPDDVELPEPSRRAMRLERTLATSLRPLADHLSVHGVSAHATRAGMDLLGVGKMPSRRRYWRTRDGVPGVWHYDGCGSARTGVVLYVHGGGFIWGSPRAYRALAGWLSHHAKMPVFVPHYRRAPEHPFPAAVDDAEAAYRQLLNRGVPATRITVAGDSAGGHVAASLLGRVARHGLPTPAAVALFSPMLDLTGADARERDQISPDPFASPPYALRAATAYAGGLPLDHVELDVLAADKAHWPTTLIQVGGTECMLGDAERMAKSLADNGMACELQVWPGQVHVFQVFSGILPEGRRALRYAGGFLRGAVR